MAAVEAYTSALYSALMKDLPDIEEVRQRPWIVDDAPQTTIIRRPTMDEVEVYAFPQTWGSTALGFNGLGCSAMTTALTIVVRYATVSCIYFGGSHAYTITDITEAFEKDLHGFNMRDVATARKRYSKP
jgi:hypothetical protein